MGSAEMRFLLEITRYRLKDDKHDEYIREKVGVNNLRNARRSG
jgi:hypothetical protein